MKTIFKKFFLIYLGIMVISFLIITIGLNAVLKQFFMNKGFEDLIQQSENVQKIFRQNNVFAFLNTEYMVSEIEDLERHFGSKIWLIDSYGYVYVTSKDGTVDVINQELNMDEINQVFEGKITKRTGYFSVVSKEPVITVGYPIYDNNGVIKFAMFSHNSVPEILEASKGIYTIVVASLLISIGFATVLIFMFSKKMVRDIKELNEAVGYISKGHYNYVIEGNRRDEIGELARNTNKMVAELYALDEKKRHFISDVSHDIRSPLTNIIGYSSGLLDGSIHKDEYKKYVKIIHDESRRLLAFSNEILDLAMIQNGEIDFKQEPLNIHSMILNILELNEKQIKDKKIDMQLEFSKTHHMISGDRKQLTRLFTNLIDNAIKFVNEEGCILIKTYATSDDMHFEIANTGEIIPEEQLNTIWQRFSKLDGSRGQNKQSFGLGLAIVQEIIYHHDSHIEVYNDSVHGTTFCFGLKLSNEKEKI